MLEILIDHSALRRDLAPLAGSGTALAGADGSPTLETPLIAPSGVAVGPDGRVYFSETGGQRVRRIESDGSLQTVAGTGVAGFGGDGGPASEARLREPRGLVRSGNLLYIADSGNHRVRALDLETATISSVAVRGSPDSAGTKGRLSRHS